MCLPLYPSVRADRAEVSPTDENVESSCDENRNNYAVSYPVVFTAYLRRYLTQTHAMLSAAFSSSRIGARVA